MLYAVNDMRYVLKVNPGVYYEAKDFTDQWYGRTYKPRKTDAQTNSAYQDGKLYLPLR
jgi:hypothetical protein